MGVGPNPNGITDTPANMLGMNSMANNANTSPDTHGYLASNGPNNSGDTGASLVNAVNRSNDTDILSFPSQGTTPPDGRWGV